ISLPMSVSKISGIGAAARAVQRVRVGKSRFQEFMFIADELEPESRPPRSDRRDFCQPGYTRACLALGPSLRRASRLPGTAYPAEAQLFFRHRHACAAPSGPG